ncbi:MAG: hypothetical protein P8Y18_11975 [Candidatus Bathyarchaeota archaeon]
MKLVDALLSVLFMAITGYIIGLIFEIVNYGEPKIAAFTTMAAITLAISIIFLGETLKADNKN